MRNGREAREGKKRRYMGWERRGGRGEEGEVTEKGGKGEDRRGKGEVGEVRGR